ncbi:MAG TPA: PAS domain S-box protein, partial [Longimicrobium sp.]|nr:PAS domain S-box protein [Longimicrobium sp.]
MSYSLLPANQPDAADSTPAAPDGMREEAYFRSLVENARDVIHVINADRTTRYVTPSIKRLLDYEPEELIGRSVMEFIHPDDLERALVELRAGRAAPGTGLPIEVRVKHRDGSWRIFEGVGRNLLDDPVVRGVVINSRDVTERRRREEQVRRLAAIPQESPNPIIECDLAGNPTYVNPAAQALLAELRVESPLRLLPPEHARVVRGCVGSGQGARGIEAAVGARVLSWTYHPHAALGAVHVFGEEVTERKRVEGRL